MIMKNKYFLLILIIALGVIVLSGCGQEAVVDVDTEGNGEKTEDSIEQYGITINEDSISFVDGREQQVTIEKHPERVVVLYNSYMDVWMRNGGSPDNTVGRVRETTGQEPIPNFEEIEEIGRLGALSVEKILSVEPDLVILNSVLDSQMALVEQLEENGIQVLPLNYDGKEDYFKIARLFSALNDREDLFEENVIAVEDGIEEITSKVPGDEEIKVLVMVASEKSISARDSSAYLGLMLEDLNTVNIADTASEALNHKNFSMETILEEDPDYIFVQTTGRDMKKIEDRMIQDVESNPAWSSLSAVKNDRYIILPKDLYMHKANHRYVEAYEGLAEIIYPETFN